MYLCDGFVENKVFDDLRFPMDRDPEGNEVRREAGIQLQSR